MIYLDLDTPKSVVMTLYSNCSNITNPYFTFLITNKDTNESFTFSQFDNSYAPYYWNSFTFSISSTQSGLTAGIIQCPAGTYVYNVYEMQEYGNLIIASATNLVENGLLFINPTFSELTTNTQFDETLIRVNNNLDRI